MAGSFEALSTGQTPVTFRLNLWLFNIHLEHSFSTVFSLTNLVEVLFMKAKEGLEELATGRI